MSGAPDGPIISVILHGPDDKSALVHISIERLAYYEALDAAWHDMLRKMKDACAHLRGPV